MIDLEPDDEQLAVSETARQILAKVSDRPADALTGEELRAVADAGLFGLGIPHELGGIGYGAAEEVLAFEAAGSVLASVGLIAPVLAAHVLAEVGDERVLESVLSGATRVGLADPWRWGAGVPVEGTWRVVDGAGTDLLVLVDAASVSVVEVRSCSAEDRSSFDPGVTQSIVSGAEATVVGRSQAPAVRSRPSLLVAAMLAGIAKELLGRAVAHASEREAFGKPIGAFQAIKHRCADMAMRCDATDALVRMAAVELDAGSDVVGLVHAARVVGDEAALENARAAIQVHGGLGFTAEAGLDRYLRRAHVLATLFGPTAWHADRLVEDHGAREE